MGGKKEQWKKIRFEKFKPEIPYAVSSQGRFGVMDKNGDAEARNFAPQDGTYRYNYKYKGKSKSIIVSKAVAQAFVKGKSAKRTMIIHKDHNFLNNHPDNLQWVTPEEHRRHVVYSPKNIHRRKKKAIIVSETARKFNESSIRLVKKLIWDKKRTLSLSQIAKKYKVSEMQIYRIKRGEIWFHVRVAGEPEHKRWKENLAKIQLQKKLKHKK